MSQLREPQQQQQKCRRKQRKSCKDLLGPRRGIELLRFLFFFKDLLAYFGTSVNVHSLVLSFATYLTFRILFFLMCQVGKTFITLIIDFKWYLVYQSFFVVLNTQGKPYLMSALSYQIKKEIYLVVSFFRDVRSMFIIWASLYYCLISSPYSTNY